MDRARDQTGLNGPIPYHNQAAPAQKGTILARPDSGKNDQNSFGNIQSTNLRSLQSLSLNGSYQLNHQQGLTAENGQSQMKTPLTPKMEQVKKPQPLDVNKGGNYQDNSYHMNHMPCRVTKKLLQWVPLSFHESFQNFGKMLKE